MIYFFLNKVVNFAQQSRTKFGSQEKSGIQEKLCSAGKDWHLLLRKFCLLLKIPFFQD